MTGEPSRHLVIVVIVPCWIASESPPPLVTIVLLLETLMTALVFWAFWTSSESAQYDLGPFTMTGIPAPTVLASVTGAGEQ